MSAQSHGAERTAGSQAEDINRAFATQPGSPPTSSRHQGPHPQVAFPQALRAFLSFAPTFEAQQERINPSQLLQVAAQHGYRGYLEACSTLFQLVSESSGSEDGRLKELLVALLESATAQPWFATLIKQAFLTEDGGLQVLLSLSLQPKHQFIVLLSIVETGNSHQRAEGLQILHAAVVRAVNDASSSLSLTLATRIIYCLQRHIPAKSQQLQQALSHSLRPQASASTSQDWLLALPVLGSMDQHLADVLTNATQTHVAGARGAPDVDLAGLLEELGPSCTSSKSVFEDVLQKVGRVDEVAAARAIAAACSGPNAGASTADPYGVLSVLSVAMDDVCTDAGSSGSDSDRIFNVEVIVDALTQANGSLDWSKVAESMDTDKLLLKDKRGFMQLVLVFKRAMGGTCFPIASFLSLQWKNPSAQLSFLAHAVMAPPEVLSFQGVGRAAPPLEGLQGGKLAVGSPNHAWLSLDLLEGLCAIYGCGLQQGVHAVLDYPLKHCPEVLVASMAAARTEAGGQLRKEVCAALLPAFLANNPNSSTVLHRVWPLYKEGVLSAMADLYSKDPTSMSRIADICQELKITTEVLAQMRFPFSLELAALAARREYLNLEKWLQDFRSSFGSPFVLACLEFLDDKTTRAAGAGDKGPDGQPAAFLQLSSEVQALFFRFLHSNLSSMPFEAQEALSRVQAQAAANPQMPQGAAGKDGDMMPPPQAEVFAADIEAEANSYFQKIYTAQSSISEVVGMLKSFKSSSSQREQEIFACMVHNLFDEYRFFPKYPDKELHITAVLFGQLVQHQLVSSITLGIALRYVLDALRKPLNSKMFTFGVEALTQFRSSLGLWAQYSNHIMSIGHFQQAQPELYAYIRQVVAESASKGGSASQRSLAGSAPSFDSSGAGEASKAPGAANGTADSAKHSSMENRTLSSFMGSTQDLLNEPTPAPLNTGGAGDTPLSSTPTAAMPTTPTATTAGISSPAGAALPSISHLSGSLAGGSSAAPSFAATINAETLEQAAEQWQNFPQPEEAVQDKIHFLINNVSIINMETKSVEVRKQITDEFLPWFANYMVVKRAAQEPNFHALYLSLLDKMNYTKLTQLTVRTTHHYTKILLGSDRVKTNSGERSLLKNLGSFLGQLTIAKNKPVLQKDLDVKAIIVDAYQRGKMIAVIPFVHKVLESCNLSKIFKPPNPWLMGIMALLSEIYGLDKLKLNLKFEIEMLFKDLQLSINEVNPSEILKAKQREVGPSNPDFSVDKAARATASAAQAPAVAVEPEVKVTSSLDGSVGLAVTGGTGTGGADQQMHLHAYVVINQNLAIVAERLQLKRVVPVAVDRAICEIITPVVERSVTIACMTTQELIVKDFAMEPDDVRMRAAAHQMVSSLAGSLALVTCKEPLRVSLSNQLRQLLQPSCEASLLDQAVTMVSQDNLDLGCTIIEKAATDKAVRDIDERLMPVYQMRQKAKASGQPFYDPSMENRIPASLPDALRPLPGHINPQQQRVYDDFSRVPRASTAAQGLPQAGARSFSSAFGEGEQQEVAQPTGEHMRPSGAEGPMDRLSEKYMIWQSRLEAFTLQDPTVLFGSLPEGSDGRKLMAELADLCRKIAGRDELSLNIGQRLFRALTTGQPTRMHITSYVTALEVLRDSAMLRRLPMEITQWYAYLDEERRWNRTTAEALMRAHLLHLPDFDANLAKALSAAPFGPASELAVHLIRTCLLSQEPAATAADLYSTLDVLAKIAARSSRGEALIQLVEQARQAATRRPGGPDAGRPIPGVMAKPMVGSKADKGDPLGLREQVALLFDEWARTLETQPNDKLHSNYVGQLRQAGLLEGKELTERFLRILTELAVAHCINTEQGAGMGRPGTLSFVAIDALVRLLTCLIQGNGLGGSFLAKALLVITRVLQGDADDRAELFNSRPYFRLILGLIHELGPVEAADPNGNSFLVAIAAALHALAPTRVPGFAFSWLELISHRQFMPKLLLSPQARAHFQRLVVAGLKFLEPYLRAATMSEAMRLLYRGTLRMLLVLLHDFPEFLCENHFALCDAIPTSCIQMRNLILSAFPRNMRLPDPFTPNLKVDLLPEISQAPRITPDVDHMLPKPLQEEVDMYLKQRQPMTLLIELRQRLLHNPNEQALMGTRYNVSLINSLVLYVGVQSISAKGQGGAAAVMHSPAMDIFQRLSVDLDSEGRYLFLNAIANQLRFPNSHTHYFSCVLLFLFAEAQQEIIQEQITRVLLERLIVNRPHPWGLLITFIELIKNPRYNFWSHSFTRCAQEIEKLFESVARSCMGAPPKAEDDMAMKQDSAVRG